MDESSANSLLCNESESCFIGSDAEDDGYCHESSQTEAESVVLLGLGDEDEYIESLIQKETVRESETSVSPPPLFGQSIDGLSWRGRARLDSVEWIMNATTFLGFHYQTAYLAVTYLDRFLARRNIGEEKLWAMRLLSVACLSLAAKMDECHVPALSDFPTQKYNFENRLITRMELLILSTLDWKMSSITPFCYIQFFIDKLSVTTSDRKQLLSAATELVFAASKEINLVEYRPSTIAAAAVLASSSGQLTREVVETKMGVISSWRSLVIEHVFSCCNLMQDIKKGTNKTPKETMLSSSMDDGSMDSPYISITGGSISQCPKKVSATGSMIQLEKKRESE